MENSFSLQYDTKEWKARRIEILTIDNNRCRRCGSNTSLEVHHIHYKNGFKVWEYSDDELVTLCKSCHQEVHHYKDEINHSLFVLMSSWCMGESINVADYYDAKRIMTDLTTLGGNDSRVFADISHSTAMTLRIARDD